MGWCTFEQKVGVDWGRLDWMDAPKTEMTTRAPAVLTMSNKNPRDDYSLMDFVGE